MTAAVSVDDIIAQQEELVAEFEKARLAMFAAREEHDAKKAELLKFNQKYGRVINMMKADEE